MNSMGGMPYSNTYQTNNYSYRLPTYEIVRVNGRGGANSGKE